MDWIAKIYVIRDGYIYRIKVFDTIVTVECQSKQQTNLLFDRLTYSVYSQVYDAWQLNQIDYLLTAYENEIAKENEGTA